MRPRALLALTAVTLGAALGGCAVRARPYRFASPMLGSASLPPASLAAPAASTTPPSVAVTNHARRDRIRVVSAPSIREASAAAAMAVAQAPAAHQDARARLDAPHQIAKTVPLPTVTTPAELRTLVGRRDPRDPIAAAVAWASQLGYAVPGVHGTDLIAWAEHGERLAGADAVARPGDLLVFDHATSDDEADLVAIVVDRDPRGVTEFVYVGGGVVRRGFVDPARPATKRDDERAVVNTFLRHGRRWPAKGDHYLAGELLANVIHLR